MAVNRSFWTDELSYLNDGFVVGSARVPAGNYIAVIRDRSSGQEVHRARVSLVR
jgi:hypothetical protein